MAATKKKSIRKKASRKKTTRKRASRPKSTVNKKRGTSLARMTTKELVAELARRQRRLPMLERQHADLVRKLEAIESEITGMGISVGVARGRGNVGRPVGSGGGKRPKNAKNLEDMLIDTLRGKKMSVAEATAAVQARGYKTTAANFHTIVNAAMLKSKKIKKVSRGVYTAK